jgi:cell shape-determining protein MreC
MKDEESAKNVYGEFNQKDQRIAELEKENEELKQQLAEQIKTVNIERRINNEI